MPTMTKGANGQPARLMTIGEVSKRSGFTIRTLRFYERRGLCTPCARRPSGYRLYSEVDLRRLAFIRQAKTLGLTLAAIHQLVLSSGQANGGGTRNRLLRVLAERINQTTDQITTLTDLRTELKRRHRVLAGTRRTDRGQGYCTCLEKTVHSR